jgi:ABC-2 type transport system permease protein
MLRVLNAERIKLASTRSPWWCVGAVIVIALGLSALEAKLYKPTLLLPEFDTSLAVAGMSGLGMYVLMIMAALAITNEHRFGIIRTTFQATPNRTLVLAAKVLLLGVLCAVVSVVLGFGAFFMAKALAGTGPDVQLSLSDGYTWRVLLGLPLYAFLCVTLAVALGALLRQSAATIALLVLWPLLIEGLLSALGSFGRAIKPFMPFSNGQRFLTSPALQAADRTHWHWSPWGGIVYFAVIVAVVCAIAVYTVNKRDA